MLKDSSKKWTHAPFSRPSPSTAKPRPFLRYAISVCKVHCSRRPFETSGLSDWTDNEQSCCKQFSRSHKPSSFCFHPSPFFLLLRLDWITWYSNHFAFTLVFLIISIKLCSSLHYHSARSAKVVIDPNSPKELWAIIWALHGFEWKVLPGSNMCASLSRLVFKQWSCVDCSPVVDELLGKILEVFETARNQTSEARRCITEYVERDRFYCIVRMGVWASTVLFINNLKWWSGFPFSHWTSFLHLV